MARIIFWQGRRGSKGAMALRGELKDRGYPAFRVKARNSRYIPRPSDFVIIWGTTASFPHRASVGGMLGSARGVRNTSNKIRFFETLSMNPVISPHLPNFSTNIEEAGNLFEESYRVYCRTLVSSSAGRGIVIAEDESALVEAPLYVGGIEVDKEYRVHVIDGKTVDFAEKKRMSRQRLLEEGITLSEDIRNHSGGYVFARDGVELPQRIQSRCEDAAVELNCGICAIDVITDRLGEFFLLEGNTSPGLVGTTIKRYADKVEEIINHI